MCDRLAMVSHDRELELADAPRKVPFGFVLAELLPFRWWYLFAMFLVAIPPIIVWIMQPELVLPSSLVVLVVFYGVQFRNARERFALLKWGQVATILGSEVLSRGTYYGGTTYSNVVLPVASGWTVTRPWWSGPKTKTRIRYSLDGYQGDLTVGGREYIDGVVLADQRRPERALCVTSFPYDLDRDQTGNWTGRLRVRLQVGMICWLVIMICWVGGAALLYTNYEHFLASRNSPPPASATRQTPSHVAPAGPVPARSDGTVTVNGARESRSIECGGTVTDVIVNGAANDIEISGHCVTLTVSGSGNHVSVDVADAITANGMDNAVTYGAGAPTITNVGSSNTIRPG